MDKLRKIILMAFVGVVLPCLSFAYPDTYFFNNYLSGVSPYSVPVDDMAIPDDGMWEKYTVDVNRYNGLVFSFDSTFMHGDSYGSAVPLLNLDNIRGNNIELPAGHCVAVYSSKADITYLTANTYTDLYYTTLGTTRASNIQVTSESVGSISQFIYTEDYSGQAPPVMSFGYINGSFYTNVNSFTSRLTIPVHDTTLTPSALKTPYADNSYVYLIFNFGSNSVYLRGSANNISLENVVSFETIPYTRVAYTQATFGFGKTSGTLATYVYLMPHLRGNIDVYTSVCPKSQDTYYISWIRGGYYLNYITPTSVSRFGDTIGTFIDMPYGEFNQNVDLIPYFLHQYNASSYLYNKAVYIKGGYIDITNYDSLVAKLKENGIGQADLTRVIELLEEINTGGATGAEVKEMIGILENYHNQLIQNGDFGSITNIFDTYKNLLDFSSDMHWLITANNALFGYFAGFIMLCAMFLTLSRIMR